MLSTGFFQGIPRKRANCFKQLSLVLKANGDEESNKLMMLEYQQQKLTPSWFMGTDVVAAREIKPIDASDSYAINYSIQS